MDLVPPRTDDTRQQQDQDFAVELGPLLDDFRRLDEPSLGEPALGGSARLQAVLRTRVLRRRRLRPLEPSGLSESLQVLWLRLELLVRRSRASRVVLGLLVLALASWAILPWATERFGSGREGKPSSTVAAVLPGGFLPSEEASSQPLAGWDASTREDRLRWLHSESDLRRLRSIWDERGKVALHRRLRRVGGADDRTQARIRRLADEVADDLASFDLKTGYESVELLSLGLRSLLGSGSTTVRGPHRRIVRRAVQGLENQLDDLHGADLATGLAAYVEVALVTGERSQQPNARTRMQRLSENLVRFVVEELTLIDAARTKVEAKGTSAAHQGRPRDSMNRWSCPTAAIADAGMILRIAPALGVPPAEAARLRSALFDHLWARGFGSEPESSEAAPAPGARGAAARAALLLAYGDLADRTRLRASLRGFIYQPDRFGSDLRAVHNLAWSVFPGAGWARFNRALRYFSANHSCVGPRDRAALLLVQLLYTAPNLASL